MMNKPQFSAPVKRLIAEAISDAGQFQDSAVAEEADAQVVKALAGRPVDYLYEVALGLIGCGNYHGRIAFAEAVGGRHYDVNIKDCWKAVCMAARFREQSTLSYADRAATPDALYAVCNARWIPAEIASLAFAIWKLYLIDDESEATALTPLFELFDRRMDVTSLSPSEEDVQGYDLAVCVSLLVGRGETSLQRLAQLVGGLPVFGGVAEFWGDDNAFKRFTERAAQWHLDYSLSRSDQFWAFATVAPDVLFPAWIFALDKYRQQHFAKASSLGEHELLSVGQEVLKLAKSQGNRPLSALTVAKRHYAEVFGESDAINLSFWTEFLARAD